MEATRAPPASLSLQTAGSCLLVSPSREATRTSGWRGITGASDDPDGHVGSRGVGPTWKRLLNTEARRMVSGRPFRRRRGWRALVVGVVLGVAVASVAG